MPTMSPGDRLARFLTAILPTSREVQAAEGRADRIVARLKRYMDVRSAEHVGSHWKGTAVRRYSDYDLFVVVSRDEAKKWAPSLSSTTILARVRSTIHGSYPTTGLRIDRQAVRVSFEQGAHAVDVVPAVFESFSTTHKAPIYIIPDGEGGWLSTAPNLHKRLVDDAHARSGRKLKSLVRMLKWWASSRLSTFRISSLYIEWFVIFSAIPVGYTYQEALAAVFAKMIETKLPALTDPYGVSLAAVEPVRTLAQRRAVLTVVDQSATRAIAALEFEARGRFGAAIERWDLVFNGDFPSALR